MHPYAFRIILPPLRTTCIVGGLLLAGCAATGGQNSNGAPGLLDNLLTSALPSAPETEKTDCGTAAQCKSALKTMIDDPNRSWVGQQQSPHVYADGTRLFAYRVLRKKLNCRELTLAVDEIRTASKSLNGPVPGVTPEQVSRTRALNTQVEGELVKERAGRCRA